ncbi:hypothetical protein AB0G64_11010 [Streptomyces longwoodensis]|uniref:hypothetical protein n=1 Tax=Streptomyces longwoodensis TaxID=68231 RepID=UPI0034059498
MKRAVVPVVAGAGEGLTLTIEGLDDNDIVRARELALSGNVDHPLVVTVVGLLVVAAGEDPGAYEWSADEFLALLDMLGMKPSEWSEDDDVELTRLLADAAGGADE